MKPRDEMLDHEYDGIREFDNPPPGWIMAILYVTLVVAVGYWLYYHIFDQGKLPVARYNHEMALAAEAQLAKFAGQAPTDESMLLMSQTPAATVEGAQIFSQFCVACHLADGSGSVGPNLTDGYWLHGGRPLQILNTVTNGVPEKGMVAWASQLGPARVQKVSSYVLTLKGKNLPGMAPQGVPEVAAPAAPAGATPAPAAGAPAAATPPPAAASSAAPAASPSAH